MQLSKFCQSIIRHPVLSSETSSLTKTEHKEFVNGIQNLNGIFNLTKTDEMFEDCFCAMSGLSHKEFDGMFQDTNFSLLITVIEPKDSTEFSKYKIVPPIFLFLREKCVIRERIHFRFDSEHCACKKNPLSVSRLKNMGDLTEGSDWYQIYQDWIGTAFGLCFLMILRSTVPNI